MSKQVAVIIPCYNSARYIPGLMESFLNQTFKDIELIIVNDKSTDGTYEAIEDYRDKLASVGINLIHVEQGNNGIAEAINTGLKHVDSEFMMWMDVDDFLLPNAIEVKRQFLIDHPEYDFALCKGYIVDETDIDKPLSIVEQRYDGKGDFFKSLILEHGIFFCGIRYFVRTSSLWKAIPTKHICGHREGQNWQLLLPLAHSCAHGYIDDILFKYVVHNDSSSHKKRSYDETIVRRTNFIELLTETINSLPGMEDDEKRKWIRMATNRQVYAKLLAAEDYYKKKEYKKYFRELKKEGVKIPFKDRYFSHFCHHAANYLKRKILRRKAGA